VRYKFQTGSFAWLIHRITGAVLTLYVFLHLYVLSHLKDPAQYTSVMETMKNPLVKLSEAGLLGLVIGHALNGIRLTSIDMGVSTKLHKPLFWSIFALGGILFIYGSVFIIGGMR
jgi:succinate dehydrogenase / fumarate reductase, cytochrome b subunit